MKPNLVIVSCFVLLATVCAEVSSRSCSGTNPCPEGECCVISDSLRRRIGQTRYLRPEDGSCKPLGQAKDFCYVRLLVTPPTGQHLACPCASGLACRATGALEGGIGYTGRCK